MTQQKHIIVGIGAGISAYRSLELIRLFTKSGFHVTPAPTKNALQFVTELSVETLAKNVCLSEHSQVKNGQIQHIEKAYQACAIVVAPATCDFIAKYAQGIADEILLQTLYSFKGPVILAPAMETNMWEHPATQQSIQTLQQRGVFFIGPNEGELASGRQGIGRMAEPQEIFVAVQKVLAPQDFSKQRVLVTAGPTVEDIDPVRFLSNRSSGKMGLALTQALLERGAQVELVHGPIQKNLTHPHLVCHPVRSAQEMYDEVNRIVPNINIAICCAAVADYKPLRVFDSKMKKSHDTWCLELVKNPDILLSIGKLKKERNLEKPFLVGFAAETDHIVQNAMDKCRVKNCDLICANDVTNNVFEQDDNAIYLVNKEHIIETFPRQSKTRLAHCILDEIIKILNKNVIPA